MRRVYRLILAVVPIVDNLEQVLAISRPSIRRSYHVCWRFQRFLVRYHRMALKRLLWCCLLFFLPRLCLCLLCCCLVRFDRSILPRPPLSRFRARKDNQLFYARPVYACFVCSRGELADCGFGDAGLCFYVAVGGFEDEEHD